MFTFANNEPVDRLCHSLGDTVGDRVENATHCLANGQPESGWYNTAIEVYGSGVPEAGRMIW